MVIKKLRDFLDKNKLSYAKFGKAIGRHRSQVEKYVNGKCKPKKEAMKRITTFTNNEVQPNDFYDANESNESIELSTKTTKDTL